MLHAKFVEIGPLVLDKKMFEGFYHIWGWRSFWSCGNDPVNKLSFSLTMEAPHKIST